MRKGVKTSHDDRIKRREGYWEEEYDDPQERKSAIEQDNYRRLTFIFEDVQSLIGNGGLDWVSINDYPNRITYNFRGTFLPMRIYKRDFEKILVKGDFNKLNTDVKGVISQFLNYTD